MNELLIVGIIGIIFILMFIMTTIIENLDVICEWIVSMFRAIGEWWFKLGCAHYKRKHHRNRGVYRWER